MCTDNVTDLRIPEGESGFSKPITAYVCQAVIIPPEVTGYKAGVSSQHELKGLLVRAARREGPVSGFEEINPSRLSPNGQGLSQPHR